MDIDRVLIELEDLLILEPVTYPERADALREAIRIVKEYKGQQSDVSFVLARMKSLRIKRQEDLGDSGSDLFT
jgi:hypothetical protein